jgi:cell division protein FtsB
MKFLLAGLVVLLLLLQYRMWLGDGGMREVARLRNEITQQRDENTSLRERNRTLAAEVQDLKKGTTAIEERARTDLGMVGQGETFYQVVIPRDGGAASTEGKASDKPAASAPGPAKADSARSGSARSPSDRRVAEAGKK